MSFFDGSIEDETAKISERQKEFMTSTGNDEFDRSLGGGFPLKSLSLIMGNQGSGKTILAQQICFGALKESKKSVTYITSQQMVRDLVTNMENMSWDVKKFFIEGKLKVIPVYTRVRSVLESPWLLDLLEETILEDESDIIVVDSLAHFATDRDEKRLTNFFVLMKGLCGNGKTIIINVPQYFVNRLDYEYIKAVCTVVLELSMIDQKDDIIRVLKLLKFQTVGERFQAIIPFEVDPAVGIRISAIMEA